MSLGYMEIWKYGKRSICGVYKYSPEDGVVWCVYIIVILVLLYILQSSAAAGDARHACVAVTSANISETGQIRGHGPWGDICDGGGAIAALSVGTSARTT